MNRITYRNGYLINGKPATRADVERAIEVNKMHIAIGAAIAYSFSEFLLKKGEA